MLLLVKVFESSAEILGLGKHAQPWYYRCLLRFYPASFRAEFAAEMHEVLDEAVADAAQGGREALARLCLREIRTWPGAEGREWAANLEARLGTDLASGTDWRLVSPSGAWPAGSTQPPARTPTCTATVPSISRLYQTSCQPVRCMTTRIWSGERKAATEWGR